MGWGEQLLCHPMKVGRKEIHIGFWDVDNEKNFIYHNGRGNLKVDLQNKRCIYRTYVLTRKRWIDRASLILQKMKGGRVPAGRRYLTLF